MMAMVIILWFLLLFLRQHAQLMKFDKMMVTDYTKLSREWRGEEGRGGGVQKDWTEGEPKKDQKKRTHPKTTRSTTTTLQTASFAAYRGGV
jgi:hypothetical protein